MNIKVPHSWLKTLLETPIEPRVIANKLSLSGPSVEKMEKVGDDWVYQIEVTTNRPDAFSIWGIAQEINAIFKFQGLSAKLKEPLRVNETPRLETKELSLEVKIEKEELCPRFTAVILDHVKIKPSPVWAQKHLELSGIRAINSAVDISNYLMLELGQPMHTFDYDKILGSKMVLRESRVGENIVTLDGVKRNLPLGSIVIEDEKRLIDLCGIMGGENSQVDENTKRVLLFVQTYDPAKIRKTTRELGFITEASSRFEKGLDTEGVMPGINRAVKLFQDWCDAKVASKVIDIYPHPYKPKTVSLIKKRLNHYLGTDITLAKARDILELLNFEAKINGEQIEAKIPSKRAGDIEQEEDLIEEIGRIWGYNKVPNILPSQGTAPKENFLFFWQDKVKDYLKFQGFYEVYTYSMISKSDLEALNLNPNTALKIRNPLNLDLEYMRPTLLPSHLLSFAKNKERGKGTKLFELANIYLPQKEGELPNERLTLAGLWQTSEFLALKGVLEGLFDELSIDASFIQKDIPNYVSGLTAQVLSDGKELGEVGKLDPKVAKTFGIEDDIFVFGLDFEILSTLAKLTKKFVPISRYPEVQEDISMIVDKKTEIVQISKVLKEAGDNLLTKVEPFDIFEDEKFGPNKKSVAVHLVYQSQNHSLSSKEVEKVRNEIIKTLEKNLGAKVRLRLDVV
ncbi:phenylalanine--tRNA ligase subunit beta [Candidatus Curtissbacteria bacterium RBG_16_39_7]|uniref:Phenylalanine--tRNA ligase beta subunit n=1 Tax=Candidatus Curtissbacteria bacterium RBG_16_39_7 TaxID=1797707 RepID=A0A1F5G2C3_9BACT|nr:MAG: phenylalanine--tRNA ligase subunit beta [Candidatus Curtissbacteria bacterium RBG_16_39_7]